MLGNTNQIIGTLADLRRSGVRLAIDDFGTGFSSLGYLKQYSVDALKIDRSFVENVVDDRHDLAIIQSVVAVAATLDLVVTAEGIENSSQAEAVRSAGCDHGQGFYFSPAGFRRQDDSVPVRSLWFEGLAGFVWDQSSSPGLVDGCLSHPDIGGIDHSVIKLYRPEPPLVCVFIGFDHPLCPGNIVG